MWYHYVTPVSESDDESGSDQHHHHQTTRSWCFLSCDSQSLPCWQQHSRLNLTLQLSPAPARPGPARPGLITCVMSHRSNIRSLLWNSADRSQSTLSCWLFVYVVATIKFKFRLSVSERHMTWNHSCFLSLMKHWQWSYTTCELKGSFSW